MLLVVKNIDVLYDDFQVIWDVSINVNKAEMVALLGPNGSGKSTVLNTILSSENINNQIQQNRNFVVRNPDFTVAAEKTINTVVHVKNTAKSKGSNSLWDLFYGNSDDRKCMDKTKKYS